MPITIIDPAFGALTPGAQINAHTDTIGPIPLEWEWRISLVDATTEAVQLQQRVPTFGSRDLNHVWLEPNVTIIQANSPRFMDGAQARLLIELVDQTNVVKESASTAVHYDPVTGLPAILQQQTTSNGFTTQDRETINTTAATTEETNQLSLAIQSATQVVMQLGEDVLTLPIGEVLVSHLLDFLSDRSLSNGVTCDPVRYDASLNSLYGVVVRIDSYPPEWEFRTPDGEWGFHDLATLRIVRGGTLVQRHGIHTLTHTMSPLPGLPFPWLNGIPAALQPPDFHIWVDWADGVCGELIGQVLP